MSTTTTIEWTRGAADITAETDVLGTHWGTLPTAKDTP